MPMMPTAQQGAARCHYYEVDPNCSPGERRYDAWRALSCVPTTGVDLLDRDKIQTFDGHIRRVTAHGVGSFADIGAPGLRVQRRHSVSPDAVGPDMQLTFVIDGAISTESGNRSTPTVIEPGALRVVDLAPPFESRWQGRHLRLNLSRAALAASFGGDPGWLHGKILPNHRLTPMLADQLRALAMLTAQFDETACALALQTTIDFTLMVLRLELGRAPPDPESTPAGLFAAARTLIAQRLSSPDLNPGKIAARLGCSRAHLYRVFAQHDLSVADYIREQRLQRCRAVIEASADSGETIADLAFGVGFQNPVHFSRVFKARFGMSPREHRRLAARAAFAQHD
jgi:AraC-like DNA-binding protein